MKMGFVRRLQYRSAITRQRGVSIISAIFLLLLFAALAAFMVSLSSTANMTSAQDVEGARAYQAAQAGLEWSLYSVLVQPASGCPAVAAASPRNIEGFVVTLNCTPYGPYVESGVTFWVYGLTARANNGAALGSHGFIEREVYASVSR